MKAMIHRTTIVAAIGTAAFAALYFFLGGEPWFSLLLTFGTTFYHFVMRLCVGWCVDRAARGKRFAADGFWFRPKRWEESFYRFLRVKAWKEKVPSYVPDGFSLKKHSLDEIVQSMCVAELVHEIIVVFSFLPLLFTFFTENQTVGLCVFLITSLVAGGIDSIFVIVQRFNRPRVVALLRKTAGRSTE